MTSPRICNVAQIPAWLEQICRFFIIVTFWVSIILYYSVFTCNRKSTQNFIIEKFIKILFKVAKKLVDNVDKNNKSIFEIRISSLFDQFWWIFLLRGKLLSPRKKIKSNQTKTITRNDILILFYNNFEIVLYS